MNSMSFDELFDKLVRVSTGYQKAIERIHEKGKTVYKDTYKVIYQKYAARQEEVLHDLFNDAVKAFYESYKPKRYMRRESLYGAWKAIPPVDERGLIDFDSAEELLDAEASNTVMRSGEGGEELFNQTFMLGWHGGAFTISDDAAEEWWPHPNYSTPYWRGFGQKPNGKLHIWGRWYAQAEQMSPSPYEIFERKVNEAYATTFPKEYKKISEWELDVADIEIYKAIPKILAEEVASALKT